MKTATKHPLAIIRDFLADKGFALVNVEEGKKYGFRPHWQRENVEVHILDLGRHGFSVSIYVCDGIGAWSRAITLDSEQWPPHAICEIIRAAFAERQEFVTRK